MIGLKQSYCISLYSQAMVVGLQAFDFDNFSFGGTIFVEKIFFLNIVLHFENHFSLTT